jgi:hypothetical protein
VIRYLSTQQHQYTVLPYLHAWLGDSIRPLNPLPYESLPYYGKLPAGTYIFSDLERLRADQRQAIVGLWSQLSMAPNTQLLNHPSRYKGRHQLITALYELGVNRFTAYSAGSEPSWTSPVFVRDLVEHTGPLSEILFDSKSLREALTRLVLAGRDMCELLVVEFCDTQDWRGIYRKYSAFRVGSRIIPRAVLFDAHWVVKDRWPIVSHDVAEMLEYCNDNPHEQRLLQVFDLAGIDYGRIDYAVLDGDVQVWEINTNPVILRPPERYPQSSPLLQAQLLFAQRFTEALFALDTCSTGDDVAVCWDAFLELPSTDRIPPVPGPTPAVRRKSAG